MRTQLLLRGDSLSVRVRRKKKQAVNDSWFNWKKCWGCFFSLLWHSLRQTWESTAQPASSHEINCTATALSAVYLTAFYTLHTDSWNECTRSRWCHMLWIINIMDPCLYSLLFVKFHTSDFKLMILWLLFFSPPFLKIQSWPHLWTAVIFIKSLGWRLSASSNL